MVFIVFNSGYKNFTFSDLLKIRSITLINLYKNPLLLTFLIQLNVWLLFLYSFKSVAYCFYLLLGLFVIYK